MNKRHINIVNELYVRQAIEEWLNNADEAACMDYGHPLYLSGEIGSDAVSAQQAIIVLDAVSNLKSAVSKEIIEYTLNKFGMPKEETEKTLASLRARRVLEQDPDGRFSIRARFYSDFLNDYIIRTIN